MAVAEEPKRPPNPYCLWLSECRGALKKESGQGRGSVGRLGGAKWKAMSDGAKRPYEERAVGLRAEYVRAMAEFKTAGGCVGKRRQEKASVKTARGDTKMARKVTRQASGMPNRPPSAYWIWLVEHREELTKGAVSAKGSDVAKFAGEEWKVLADRLGDARWKVMSDGAKQTYEERAAGLQAEYVNVMEEFQTAGGVVGKRRQEKAGVKTSRETKKARKDARQASGRPKRPPPAYWIWLGEHREELNKGAVSARGSDVAKFAGDKWKGLADSIRAPFESRAAELKAQHQKEMEEWRKKSNESGGDHDNDGGIDEGVDEGVNEED